MTYTNYYVVLTKHNIHIPMTNKIHQLALVRAYNSLGVYDVDTYDEESDDECPF